MEGRPPFFLNRDHLIEKHALWLPPFLLTPRMHFFGLHSEPISKGNLEKDQDNADRDNGLVVRAFFREAGYTGPGDQL